MPPRAIAAPVRSTAANGTGDRVRSWVRSSASSNADGGNFGADPNPPRRVSSSPRMAATARSHRLGSISGPPPGRPAAIRRNSPATWSEACSTSARWVRQVSATAASSCRNCAFG